MNKAQRIGAGKRRAAKRAKALGWRAPFAELPRETRIALSTTGGIAIPKRDDRKRFGKTSGKRTYGHFAGHAAKHLDAQGLRERAAERDAAD